MIIQASTDVSQQAFIIIADTTDISAETSFTVNIYTDPLAAPIKTYELSVSELAYFKANKIVYIPTLSIFTTFPSDGYYYVELEGSSITSDMDSVVFTLTSRGDVYAKLDFINVYAPDYNVSTMLHTAKMILDEMEAMPYLEYSTRKKIDFDFRLQTLSEIL